MIIERIHAQPNKYTFTIKPIAELLKREMVFGLDWHDPFAGMYSPALYTNDISPEANAESHLDALTWLKSLECACSRGLLFDPPYSLTQATARYKNRGFGNKRYWSQCKNEVSRITIKGGKVISFGWNSGGMGINRGFDITRILLVPHGGGRNDTIVTVEIKNRDADYEELNTKADLPLFD